MWGLEGLGEIQESCFGNDRFEIHLEQPNGDAEEHVD